WTRAVYYEGLMALYGIDVDKRYYDYAVQWGEKHRWMPAREPRTTGIALSTYGMAWAVKKGLVDRQTYLPVISKAWKALTEESCHANGFLGYVQGTGNEPKGGQPVTHTSVPDFENYGLGCFLLARSQVYQLVSME